MHWIGWIVSRTCWFSNILVYTTNIVLGVSPFSFFVKISHSELEKVKSYRQKISKWQVQVADRLQTLSQRTGCYYSLSFAFLFNILKQAPLMAQRFWCAPLCLLAYLRWIIRNQGRDLSNWHVSCSLWILIPRFYNMCFRWDNYNWAPDSVTYYGGFTEVFCTD